MPEIGMVKIWKEEKSVCRRDGRDERDDGRFGFEPRGQDRNFNWPKNFEPAF
jgi:hypothetical protein